MPGWSLWISGGRIGDFATPQPSESRERLKVRETGVHSPATKRYLISGHKRSPSRNRYRSHEPPRNLIEHGRRTVSRPCSRSRSFVVKATKSLRPQYRGRSTSPSLSALGRPAKRQPATDGTAETNDCVALCALIGQSSFGRQVPAILREHSLCGSRLNDTLLRLSSDHGSVE